MFNCVDGMVINGGRDWPTRAGLDLNEILLILIQRPTLTGRPTKVSFRELDV
jgi:hypothetical protein